jgi:hypothetical protein
MHLLFGLGNEVLFVRYPNQIKEFSDSIDGESEESKRIERG